eukprot:Clim_evm13s4 gene=Clim_evmTU13s4
MSYSANAPALSDTERGVYEKVFSELRKGADGNPDPQAVIECLRTSKLEDRVLGEIWNVSGLSAGANKTTVFNALKLVASAQGGKGVNRQALQSQGLNPPKVQVGGGSTPGSGANTPQRKASYSSQDSKAGSTSSGAGGDAPPTPAEVLRGLALFSAEGAQSGQLSPDKVQAFLQKSGQSREILGSVWALCGPQSGSWDIPSFTKAYIVLRRKAEGSMPSVPQQLPASWNTVITSHSPENWAVPVADRVVFMQYFDRLSNNGPGPVPSAAVVDFLGKSGTSKDKLARVWQLATEGLQSSGDMRADQFVLAGYLTKLASANELPASGPLPPSLIPPSFRPGSQHTTSGQMAGSGAGGLSAALSSSALDDQPIEEPKMRQADLINLLDDLPAPPKLTQSEDSLVNEIKTPDDLQRDIEKTAQQNQQVQHVSNQLAGLKSAINQETDVVNEALEGEKRKIKIMQEEKKAIQEETQHQDQLLKDKDKQIDDLKAQAEKDSRELQELKKTLNQRQEETQTKEVELNRLKEELESLRKELLDVSTQIKKQENEITRMDNEIKKTSVDAEKLKRDIEAGGGRADDIPFAGDANINITTTGIGSPAAGSNTASISSKASGTAPSNDPFGGTISLASADDNPFGEAGAFGARGSKTSGDDPFGGADNPFGNDSSDPFGSSSAAPKKGSTPGAKGAFEGDAFFSKGSGGPAASDPFGGAAANGASNDDPFGSNTAFGGSGKATESKSDNAGWGFDPFSGGAGGGQSSLGAESASATLARELSNSSAASKSSSKAPPKPIEQMTEEEQIQWAIEQSKSES